MACFCFELLPSGLPCWSRGRRGILDPGGPCLGRCSSSASEGLGCSPLTLQNYPLLLPLLNLLGSKPRSWGKNALFLVFLGINYFYGILDRQQTIKKKTVDFLLSRKQAVSTISGSLGKPGENLSIHHHNLSQNSPEVVSRASVNPGL